MIEKLSAITLKLSWALSIVKIMSIGFLCLFCFAIFDIAGVKSDTYLMPSVLGFLWSALFLFMLNTFPDVPKRLTKEAKFFARVSIIVKRGVYHLLAIIFFILSLAIILLSIKFLKVWLNHS